MRRCAELLSMISSSGRSIMQHARTNFVLQVLKHSGCREGWLQRQAIFKDVCVCVHGCRCAEAGDLFGGRVPERMRETEAFVTKDMAAAAQDATPDLATTAGVLEHAFGLPADSVGAADRQQVCGAARMCWEMLRMRHAQQLCCERFCNHMYLTCNPQNPPPMHRFICMFAAPHPKNIWRNATPKEFCASLSSTASCMWRRCVCCCCPAHLLS